MTQLEVFECDENYSLLDHQKQSPTRMNRKVWQCCKLTTCTLIFALLIILIVLLAIRVFRKEPKQEEIIHVLTINAGSEYAGRLEMLVKSILLFHSGIVHIHVLSDARAQDVLSIMFQTWRIKRLRWSLYELDRAHGGVDYIPTAHRAGNMGFLRIFAHDVLPLYVEKVILMDTDTIILEDIAVMHGYFKQMELQGAFFGASPDMYRRYGIRPKLPSTLLGINVGVVMLDLKRMRETNWDDLWREETLTLLHEFGPPSASEQDTFAAFEFFRPNWCYRLPCYYNFQLGEWAVDSICLGDSGDLEMVKVPHWTEAAKWTSDKPSAKYFTSIYQCIQVIEWTEINGLETDRNMAPARTLLYMRDGEMPIKDKRSMNATTPEISRRNETVKEEDAVRNSSVVPATIDNENQGEISLAVTAPFSRAFALIDRVRQWPGPVDLIVVGTDRERMELRDFLLDHKKEIGTRISIHFVHRRANLEPNLFNHYLHKLSADIARTDMVLVAFDIDKLDISEQTYNALASEPSYRFTAVYDAGSALLHEKKEIGLKTTKKKAQRFAAERTSMQECANLIKRQLFTFTSARPALLPAAMNYTKREYPSFEHCRLELGKRKPLILIKP